MPLSFGVNTVLGFVHTERMFSEYLSSANEVAGGNVFTPVSVKRGSLSGRHPPYGKEREVRILLE